MCKGVRIVLSVLVLLFLTACALGPYKGGLIKSYTEDKTDKDSVKSLTLERTQFSKDGKSIRFTYSLNEKTRFKKYSRKVFVYHQGTDRNRWKHKDTFYSSSHPVSSGSVDLHLYTRGFETDKGTYSTNDGKIVVTLNITEPRYYNEMTSNDTVGILYRTGTPLPAKEAKVFKLEWDGVKLDQTVKLRDVYPMVNEAVKQIFAEKIIQVKIVPTNIDSHYPFGGSDVSIHGKAPSPTQLLKPYFKDKALLAYAAERFPSYVRSSAREAGTGTFRVVPGTYSVEIKNPGYYYLKKKVKMTSPGVISVFMSELGTKQRVQIQHQ